MNIVIAGGQTKADFLISMFKKERHNLVVINDSVDYADYLSKKHNIDVIVGDPTSTLVLSEAEIEEFDILVALTPSDTDNLMICQLGKKMLHIHKTVASVSDPTNVDYFTSLGVDTAISATYLISKYIEKASVLENMTRTIVTEFDSLSITTITVLENSNVANRSLSEIKLPEGVSLGAILRQDKVMVPNGKSVIKPGDKILMITSADMQNTAINIINSERKETK
ncbi:MAG TPA: potassium transporter TrkA [Firmicutes bacterium]|nr:potassium transporter TrkA [Bacillota bacterium]